MATTNQRSIRAVILGAEKTGKTALVKKYTHSIFTEDYNPLFEGVDQKEITVDGVTCTLELFPAEPAAEQLLCQTGEAFILMYAINNRKSFQHLRQLHTQIKQAKSSTSLDRFPIFLVGSKADLEHERKVTLEEGMQLAIELRCQKLFEVSAKDHIAEINDMMEKLVRQLLQIQQVVPNRPPISPISTIRTQGTASKIDDAPPRRSSVLDRFKFGSLRRKSSMQSLRRKESGSFNDDIINNPSANKPRVNMRSVSYSTPTTTPSRPSNISKITSSSSPYRLDVDTSSWRETVRWPADIIPEEDVKAR